MLLPLLIDDSSKRPEHHFGQFRPFAWEDDGADSATAVDVDAPVNLCPGGLVQPLQKFRRIAGGRFGPCLM
jgi:hypothetical protein